jgi:putative ABC transport system substrate-binding protein
MKRREFVTLLSGAVAASSVSWPLTAPAQQKLPTIGFLGTSTVAGWSQWTAAFVQRLRELGWIEGRTVAIEYRWAEGRTERYAEIAAEFVRMKVDVIVMSGSAGAAVKQATSVIPVVFAVDPDPLGSGLVASLARPGGNVTGLSQQSPDLAGKRIELLREVFPSLRRLAVLGNVGYPAAVVEMNEVQATARTLGLDVVRLEIRRAEDIAPIFEGIKSRADALHVCTDALVGTHRAQIASLALGAGLPTMAGVKGYAEAGALIVYGPNNTDLFRRAGDFVDKILRGAKPADLPVEQPTRFELIVNLKTAKAFGLELSPMMLGRADEVIE